MRRERWIALLLALMTVAVYTPALRCGFIAFDDPVYVTDNPHVRSGLSEANVAWAFRTPVAGNWHPITMLSHMMDCQIYGLHPWGHHLTSIFFHAASVALLFLILTRLAGGFWRPFAVAAFFSVHPTHVESVVWISERKDVLCTFFSLLAILIYVRGVKENRRRLWLVFVVFMLALMSKPMAVTLPCVMLLLDFWPLQRSLNWKLVLEKIPLFAASALWCGVTVWAQGVGRAIATEAQLGFGERLNHALLSYWEYMRLLVFPRHLSAYYPYQHHVSPAWGALAAVGLIVLTLFALQQARPRPYLIVGWLWFVGTLVPVIGLVQVGGQAWADRYVYFPSIGFFIAVVWAGAALDARFRAVKFLAITAGYVLAFATVTEIPYWKSTQTLFTRAIAVTRNNYAAMTLLGSALETVGRPQEAIRLYQSALMCKPNYPEAHVFLGRALEGLGQTNEALTQYRKAAQLEPLYEEAHVLLGLALVQQKKFPEAITEYQAALKANPDSAVAQSDWAAALLAQGQFADSIAHYQAALKLDPTLASAHEGLGLDLLRNGHAADGTTELRAALQIEPTNSDARLNLGVALNQQQQWAAAEAVLHETNTTANPVMALQDGLALEHLGSERAAMERYRAALELNPDMVEALQHLAWIEATDAHADIRNGAEATSLAERAADLTAHQQPAVMLTLAAAYAEAGKFPDALAAVKTAETLATAHHQQALAAEATRLRELFEKSHAFHGQEKTGVPSR